MVQVHIKRLIDDVQCYQTVRELRWPDGMTCPSCQSTHGIELIHPFSGAPRVHHGGLQCARPVAWLPALCVGLRASRDCGIWFVKY